MGYSGSKDEIVLHEYNEVTPHLGIGLDYVAILSCWFRLL